MEDIRILEKKASSLAESGKKLVFRFKISDYRIVERILQPVMGYNQEEILYRDIRTEYSPKKGYQIPSLDKVDFSKMIRVGRSEESSSTTKNGVIKNRIEYILRSGYQLIEMEVN